MREAIPLNKNIPAIGIILLFIVSALTPIVIGNIVRTTDNEILVENYYFDSNYVSEMMNKGRYTPFTRYFVDKIDGTIERGNNDDLNFFDLYEIIDFGQTAWGLTSADFNNDGNVDFAVSWATCPWTLSRISIFYNDGNLGFTRDDVYTIHYYLRYITDLDSGDYDNDGDIDLMFTYNEYVWYGGLAVNVNGTVNLLFNDGENNFGNCTMVAWHGPGIPYDNENRINPQLTSADFDLDGDIDFLVGDNSGKVEFYVNDGTGNFTSAGILHDWGWASWGLTSADFDNDGDVDFLVSVDTDNTNEARVYLMYNKIIESNYTICFEPGSEEIITYTGLSACLASLDYEKNGKMDFFTGIVWNIYLHINEEEIFCPFFVYRLPKSPEGHWDDLMLGALTTADYNNDGYDDFVAGGVQGIVRLFINIQNFPPDKPSIDGPTNGNPLKKYTFTATASDREGDSVSYLFEWDDETDSGWTEFVPSGTSVSRSHRWLKEGTYTVWVRAKDVYGYISMRAELEVTLPRNRSVNRLFLNFLQKYPNLFPILQLLLQR